MESIKLFSLMVSIKWFS